MPESHQAITYFAETDFRGKKTKFGIKPDDRTKHVYIIGKTGMGKSTLLENMAVQDIQNGEGMAFIDPHGATAEKLLQYVPEHRIKDVIYFAPFDLENPLSFNVMEDIGKDQRHLVANGLMASFKKVWPDVWSARMEYILNNIILALLEYPGSTLLGVNRMLSDKDFRNKIVANITDPSVRSFWVDEFAKYTEKFMTEAGAAIQNKIGQLTANPLIRNIIGQPKSSIDVRKIMDEKKILIMNLSKGRMGEINANLIGGMLITKIYLASMSRASASPAELRALPDFYFYVDEFQSFVNDTFKDILSEARKYKLNLTIAHQYIEQMPEEVRDAVFGNVGTTIAFRVGPFDAEVLEKIFGPQFMAPDLVSLGFAQIYLTLMINGVGSPPFSAKTLGPILEPATSHKEGIIQFVHSTYARPVKEVEEDIRKWYEPVGPAPRAAVPSGRTALPPRDSAGAPPSKRDEQPRPPRREDTGDSRPPRERERSRGPASSGQNGQGPSSAGSERRSSRPPQRERPVSSPALANRGGSDDVRSPVNSLRSEAPREPGKNVLREALEKAMAERQKEQAVSAPAAPKAPVIENTKLSSSPRPGEITPDELRSMLEVPLPGPGSNPDSAR